MCIFEKFPQAFVHAKSAQITKYCPMSIFSSRPGYWLHGYTMFDVTSVTITCVKCSSFIFWALHYVTFTLPLFSGLIPSSPIWHYKSWVTCLPIKLSWMLFLWLVSIVHKNPISSVTG
uniref:Uncharacterized protein n=1 Tax=Cacopsylla melanoneura TaxID=428564 RepID=A0A8D8ZE01_9HEMI